MLSQRGFAGTLPAFRQARGESGAELHSGLDPTFNSALDRLLQGGVSPATIVEIAPVVSVVYMPGLHPVPDVYLVADAPARRGSTAQRGAPVTRPTAELLTRPVAVTGRRPQGRSRETIRTKTDENAPLTTGVTSLACRMAALAMEGGRPIGNSANQAAKDVEAASNHAGRTGHDSAARGRVAWLDPGRSFDPATAARAGVKLESLLWISTADDRGSGGAQRRMGDRLPAFFESAQLLIHSGAFALVVFDLRDVSERVLRSLPRAGWFRLLRALEWVGRTGLLVLAPFPLVGTAGTLSVGLAPDDARWRPAVNSGQACLLSGATLRLNIHYARHGNAGGARRIELWT
jgi:hypothetical protein